MSIKDCGIYRIANQVTGDCYIGSSAYLLTRKSNHKRSLQHNEHVNKHLQAAWNKYGEEAFSFEVLERCETDSLIEREQYWIDFYRPKYNKRKQAESNLGVKGWKNSPAARLKKSEAAKRRPPRDPEVIERIAAKNRGRKPSEESNRKRSESLKANKRIWTDEQRAQIAAKNRETWAKKSAQEKHEITQKRAPEVLEAQRERFRRLGKDPQRIEASRQATLQRAEERKKARKVARYALTQTAEYRQKRSETRRAADLAGKRHGGPVPDPSKPHSRYGPRGQAH